MKTTKSKTPPVITGASKGFIAAVKAHNKRIKMKTIKKHFINEKECIRALALIKEFQDKNKNELVLPKYIELFDKNWDNKEDIFTNIKALKALTHFLENEILTINIR